MSFTDPFFAPSSSSSDSFANFLPPTIPNIRLREIMHACKLPGSSGSPPVIGRVGEPQLGMRKSITSLSRGYRTGILRRRKPSEDSSSCPEQAAANWRDLDTGNQLSARLRSDTTFEKLAPSLETMELMPSACWTHGGAPSMTNRSPRGRAVVFRNRS